MRVCERNREAVHTEALFCVKERLSGKDGASCSVQTDSQTHDCTYIFPLTTLTH